MKTQNLISTLANLFIGMCENYTQDNFHYVTEVCCKWYKVNFLKEINFLYDSSASSHCSQAIMETDGPINS